ncbi:TPA: competence protein ComK [Staphylococcus argenteus]|nr:competence protein ComK [Staphylococcus argenteus]
MQVISTKHLLYIKTASSNHIKTDCVFLNYNYHLPISVNKLIEYYAKLHLKTPELQIETAKNLLNINKLIPIYLDHKAILFPIKQKRAPIQIYINAHYIIGMTAKNDSTLIHFKKGITLEVDEPISLISKKCHESLALKHFIEHTI